MNEQFADFLTILIRAVIAVGLPILIAFVAQWIRGKTALVGHRLTTEQKGLITWTLRTVVMAAEQSGLSGELKQLGVSKKEYAINEASSWLASVGLPVNLASISAQIEAIVLEFNARGWDKAETYDYW